MVKCNGLENRHTFTGIVGSNPTSSAVGEFKGCLRAPLNNPAEGINGAVAVMLCISVATMSRRCGHHEAPQNVMERWL